MDMESDKFHGFSSALMSVDFLVDIGRVVFFRPSNWGYQRPEILHHIERRWTE